MGTTATAILALARALRDNLQDVLIPKVCMGVIVGIDANVKIDNEGASATPEKLIEIAKALGFSSAWPGSTQFLNAGVFPSRWVMPGMKGDRASGFQFAQRVGVLGF